MRSSITTSVAILMSCGWLAVAGCKKETARAAPPPPPVTVAQPIVREVLDYDEFTGRLAAVEEVEVHARVRGYLTDIGFKDGDEVKKGQMLFQIDPRPFEAQVKIAEGMVEQVKSKRITAQADVARYKELVPQGAAKQQDLDKAIGQLGEAEAGIHSAEADVDRAKLDLEFAKVTAPIVGMISRANVTAGNLIGGTGSPDQVLSTIVRMDPIYVYFDVDQRAAQQYLKAAAERRGTSAPSGTQPVKVRDLNIPFHFGLASEDGFPHEGIIDFLDNKIDATTGTITVRGEAKNGERLFKPGYFARVRVAAGQKYQAVLVSDRAIGTQQGQKYVLVVDEKGSVVFRPVTLGAPQPDGLRVVRSGLKPTEQIVVNGIQRARPGTLVKAEKGEMLARPTTREVAAMQPVTGNR